MIRLSEISCILWCGASGFTVGVFRLSPDSERDAPGFAAGRSIAIACTICPGCAVLASRSSTITGFLKRKLIARHRDGGFSTNES